jgi:hypothetical protein
VGDQGAIYRWDGTQWTPEVGVPITADLLAILGNGPDEVWAAGRAGTVLLNEGNLWSALPSGTSQDLNAISIVASCDVWFAGAQGTLLHWQGTAFSPVPVPTNVDLYDVRAFADDDVWVVGDQDTILHWDGSAWASRPEPGGLLSSVPPPVTKLLGNDPAAIRVIEGATLYAYSPAGWTALNEPVIYSSPVGHGGAWQDCSNDVWLVGPAGVVRYFP